MGYKVLSRQVFESGEYKLIPIRYEDRLDIMRWRNEQIYHLRQKEPLTKEIQERYFNEIISRLFDEELPCQLLFSFLRNEECIGYGGLVHINWIDKNAEVSFLMNTKLERNYFNHNWSKFLKCLEKIAFEEIRLHKIYTYAFDLRPHLYTTLEKNGFTKEAVLKDHCITGNVYNDVVIHARFNNNIKLRAVNNLDLETTYNWAIEPLIRKYSKNKSKISFDEHKRWFVSKLNDPNCKFFIAENNNQPIGSFRLDTDDSGCGYISYLVDPKYHGKGFGGQILNLGIQIAKENSTINNLVGDVMSGNYASIKLFDKLGFTIISRTENLLTYNLFVE